MYHLDVAFKPTARLMSLPVMLYGCETLSLTITEECRLSDLKTGSQGEYMGSRHFKPTTRLMSLIVRLYGCETWSLTITEECRLRD